MSLAIAAAVLILVVLSIRQSDALIKRQHEVAREQWAADGRPGGTFWAADPEAYFHPWIRTKAQYRLLFTAPSWLAADETGRAAQQHLRLIWWLLFTVWCLWLITLYLGL